MAYLTKGEEEVVFQEMAGRLFAGVSLVGMTRGGQGGAAGWFHLLVTSH